MGQPLYEIDVDAIAAPSSSAPVKPVGSAPAAKAAPAKTVTPADDSSHEHGRVPLIKFIGKRDKTKKVQASTSAPTSSAPHAQQSLPFTGKPVKEGNGVHFTTLKGEGLFGRPPISQKEIDAIESGGAM